MNGAFTPIAIAQAVARNIVPLVGILVFHWSTGNVLLLYLLDTLLSMAVIFAGLMSTFSPPPDDEGVGGWINSEAGYVLMGLFVAAFIAVPLGMPVGIMLAASGFSFREAFNDSSLRGGALLQLQGRRIVSGRTPSPWPTLWHLDNARPHSAPIAHPHWLNMAITKSLHYADHALAPLLYADHGVAQICRTLTIFKRILQGNGGERTLCKSAMIAP
jgi:hypothetical protein